MLMPKSHKQWSAVVFDNLIIPAMNVQVEDIPEGYDSYFEIMFEDGSLWVVDCCVDGVSPHILHYPTWYLLTDDLDQEQARVVYEQILKESDQRSLSSWEEFVEEYQKKVNPIHISFG